MSGYFLLKTKAITQKNYLFTIKQTLKLNSKATDKEYQSYLILLVTLFFITFVSNYIPLGASSLFYFIFLLHLIPFISLQIRELKSSNNFFKEIKNNKYITKIFKSKKLTKNITYTVSGSFVVLMFLLISIFSSGNSYNLGMDEQKLIDLCNVSRLPMNNGLTPRGFLDNTLEARFRMGNSTKAEVKDQKRWLSNNCQYY